MISGWTSAEDFWGLLVRPDSISITPLVCMSEGERIRFESGGSRTRRLPEVGSRALTHAALTAGTSGWVEAQSGRYRYVSTIYADGFSVRLVIREYLACEAWWEEPTDCCRTSGCG